MARRPAERRINTPSLSSPDSRVSDGLELAPRLSEFDRSLIRLLQEDGRRSYARLATELGVAEKTVRRRVLELRASEIIEITTVADPELMGYRTIAIVGVCVTPDQHVSEVAKLLAGVTGAFYVVVVTGRYNILVEISCVDTDHLLTIIDAEIAAVPGVSSYEILPYLRLDYQNPSFEAATRKARGSDSLRRGPVSFDDTDRQIIALLHDDGRIPYQTMAREIGVSESQVRARVKRMVDSGAVRIMALTIPRGVGFETVALIGINVTGGVQAEPTATELAQLPSVIYVAICAGRFDLLAEVVCTNPQDLLQLLDTQIRSLPGVAHTEPWIYLKLHYRSVQPATATS
ncbi:MAG TPA: Lrp/AsnC family transcriptional regulator [Solirubrobacteraceae bacterium]|jgi:Lrp/AsnC family transcriptional regulator for asnA, asnC and gidA|nr:Lrp/AsnC family transcriptional regulator [Solirubrobacteraceae bacterium]